MLRTETSNRRSCQIRTTSESSKRIKEGEDESFEHSIRRMEERRQRLGKITFPPVSGNDNSSDPVIIKAKISERQVNRVYMDSGSSCEVIYEQCFLQLKPSIRSLRVDLKVPLVGVSREHSWPLG
ncbi:hypothetical protein Tco_0508650 [Tanacetum coccineum]